MTGPKTVNEGAGWPGPQKREGGPGGRSLSSEPFEPISFGPVSFERVYFEPVFWTLYTGAGVQRNICMAKYLCVSEDL